MSNKQSDGWVVLLFSILALPFIIIGEIVKLAKKF